MARDTARNLPEVMPQQSLEATGAAARPVSVIERLIELAANPGIDVSKIEQLITANERLMKIAAEQSFNRAFTQLQGKLPVISKTGRIEVREKGTGKLKRVQTFVSLPDIMAVITPLNKRFGFSLRFEHDEGKPGLTTTWGILAHRDGHSVRDSFTGPRDDSGEKSVIQGQGSTRSFGQRYVTIALYALASAFQEDHDGNVQPERKPKVEFPHAPPAETFDERPITNGTKDKPGQRQRLWAIVKKSTRTQAEIREWLSAQYGYVSTSEIQRGHYDAICTAIQAPGDLVVDGAEREPGEEG